jgi:tetratricopeptide (TPR) repeat protein
MQESAINTLAILKRDTAVQEICDSIDREQNLRVISRMTRTLEILTGEKYYPLDIDAVKTWWEKNRDQEKYKPCYKGLLEARAIEKRPSFGSNENDYKQVVSLLKQTTEADTNALYSKCLLGYYYTLLKDFVNAKKEFDEVEPLGNNNYRWFFFYKAVFILLQENPAIDAAIASLNRAMEISPTFETIIKSSPVFKNLLENPQLKFPSNKK